MRQARGGGTYSDAGLTFVSEPELAELATHAVALLERDADNAAAAACIACVSLQAPQALQPHLGRLFLLRPNASTYFVRWPWRAAMPEDVAFLEGVVRDEGETTEERLFTWRCLLETRREPVLRWLIENRPPAPLSSIDDELARVGFEATSTGPRRLFPERGFHLRFSDAYLADFADPPWRPKTLEPSWTLPAEDALSVRFGGAGSGTCTSCGGRMHQMLGLVPVPSGLGVTSVDRLTLETCLSCLGWELPALQVQHERDGSTQMLAGHALVTPQFLARPLREAEVQLSRTPPRWQRQDWSASNARENLHRVGGEPTWIQSPDYPSCPLCAGRMSFLAQLDSFLPSAAGGEWLWGSGGIAYFFWCDGCRVSHASWQCT